jgi:hypothetical protein
MQQEGLKQWRIKNWYFWIAGIWQTIGFKKWVGGLGEVLDRKLQEEAQLVWGV